MNKIECISGIRTKLANGKVAIGSWMQIGSGSVAEIMGSMGYDWIALDLEHGSIDVSQLPDLFRALELNSTLPLVRVPSQDESFIKRCLDAGAGGIIVPQIETVEELEKVSNACRWPPAGSRGVGFSRANLFGRRFENYKREACEPIVVGMIESHRGVANLEKILECKTLDAIFIGPYDLSASLGMLGQFSSSKFKEVIDSIITKCKNYNVPVGIHVVDPSSEVLAELISAGFTFIAYSIDAVFLSTIAGNPLDAS